MNTANAIQSGVVFAMAAFEARDTAILDVKDAKGEDSIGLKLEMYGPGSEQYAAEQAKIDTASQARTFEALRGKKGDGGKAQRELITKKLIALVKSVDGWPVTAEEILTNPRLGYIRNQAGAFVDDWANFLPGSANS